MITEYANPAKIKNRGIPGQANMGNLIEDKNKMNPENMTFDNFPENGLTYQETMRLFGVDFQAAIKILNKLVDKFHLVRKGEREKWPVWAVDPVEKMIFGNTQNKHGKCLNCGKLFTYQSIVEKQYCSCRCSEDARFRKTAGKERTRGKNRGGMRYVK